MKKIIQIFIRDIKGIGRHPFSIFVFIGIILLPSLYAWFNIDACWDPYSNTGKIAVAVVNRDKGAKLSGVKVNVGDMVVANLANNRKMGWTFTDEEGALEGVKSGEYYAAVTIPTGFSQNILSITSTKIITPHIEYYVNEKKNAVAPKITDKGIDMIQEQVNKTFVETATDAFVTFLEESDKQLGGNGGTIANSLVERLKLLSNDFEQFDSSITAMKQASLAIEKVLEATKSMTPDAKKLMKQTENLGISSQQVISNVKTINQQGITLLGKSFDNIKATTEGVKDTINTVATLGKKETKGLYAEVKQKCDKIHLFNRSIREAVNQLKNCFGDKSGEIVKLDRWMKSVDDKVLKARQLAHQGSEQGQLLAKERDTLTSTLHQSISQYEGIIQRYKKKVKPVLNTNLSMVSKQLDSIEGMMSSMESIVPKLSKATKNISKSIQHTVKALDSVSKMMKLEKKKIDRIVKEVENAANSEKLTKLVELLERNPSTTAKFVSSPVEVNTHSLYPVRNYGSAMSPFYTILCLWVGACILVAILKVRIRGKDRELKPYQAYFGRYLIFMLASVTQALCVCLGDIYILRIQCENPVLFVLAGVFASICFSLLVYTLTISFGDVGKAIAIILLVIQVAGAGGTFPIEVLPGVFQKMNPYMPFTYGINAMRETVAGMYGGAYIQEMLRMGICIPISLLIGLVLRKPLIALNHYLERKLEDTDIM